MLWHHPFADLDLLQSQNWFECEALCTQWYYTFMCLYISVCASARVQLKSKMFKLHRSDLSRFACARSDDNASSKHCRNDASGNPFKRPSSTCCHNSMCVKLLGALWIWCVCVIHSCARIFVHTHARTNTHTHTHTHKCKPSKLRMGNKIWSCLVYWHQRTDFAHQERMHNARSFPMVNLHKKQACGRGCDLFIKAHFSSLIDLEAPGLLGKYTHALFAQVIGPVQHPFECRWKIARTPLHVNCAAEFTQGKSLQEQK